MSLQSYVMNILFPEDNCKSSTREDTLDSLPVLFESEEQNLDLQKYHTISDFLKVQRTFIPRRESAKVLPLGSNLFFLILINSVLIAKMRFQILERNRPFFSKRTFIVWVDGRTDGDKKSVFKFRQTLVC